jgi:hypothetical protein
MVKRSTGAQVLVDPFKAEMPMDVPINQTPTYLHTDGPALSNLAMNGSWLVYRLERTNIFLSINLACNGPLAGMDAD